jgi:hypothetical protein
MIELSEIYTRKKQQILKHNFNKLRELLKEQYVRYQESIDNREMDQPEKDIVVIKSKDNKS